MKQSIIMTAMTAALVGLSGCITMQDSSEMTRQREDMLLIREELDRTKGKLESLEMEYQRLLRELDALQGDTAGSKGATISTQSRMDELDRRLGLLEQARVKDRQAIVDQLSGKLTDIMGGRTAGKAGPAARSTAAQTRAGGMTGYEHVVKEGDTLSAIAAAYKVNIGAIIEANQLKNPDALLKGQKLFIPQP